MEEMKSLFVNVPKGKILLQQILQQDSARARLNLEIFVVNVITLITLYMNPWPINITLGCRIFVTDFYMANFAGVDYIINIFGDTH